MLEWLLSNGPALFVNALAVVGAASALAKAVGALNSKWTWDDKVSAFLDKVYNFLGRIALNPKP